MLMKRLFTFVVAMLSVLGSFGQQLVSTPTHNTQLKKEKLMKKIYQNNYQKIKDDKNVKSVNTLSNAKSLLNYNFSESTTTFTSIHTTGTAITPDDWDDGHFYLDLTGIFSFNYDLKSISTFSVGTNGYLIMGKNKYPSLDNDLADTGMVPVVAPVWDDMKFFGEGINCGLFYQIDSLPTDTVLTIEWYNIDSYNYPGDSVSYQIKFHKANNVIDIIYGDMSAASNWNDASISIGINNSEDGITKFISITPGSSATISRSKSNNTIDGANLASIPAGTVYRFTPNFYNNELIAKSILPHAAAPETNVTPQVVVKNEGLNDASNYDVNLTIVDQSNNEVYNQTLTITDALSSGADTTIDMPEWSTVPMGFYTATLTVTYASDENTNDNTITQDIQIQNSVNMQDGDTTVCSMLFYDSGGLDSNYQSNENYTFVMCPSTAGKSLQVNFNSYDIEDGWDSLFIYNGDTTSAPLIATLTGTGNNLLIKAMNPAGALTFRFTSDASGECAGWEALVSCYTTPQHDLAVLNVTPELTVSDNTFTPQVVVRNNAVNNETSFDIHYSNIDGSYSGSITLNQTLDAYGGTDTILLPTWSLNAEDTLTVTVVLNGDEDNTNDELEQGIAVINTKTLGGNIRTRQYVFVDLSDASELPIGSINNSPYPTAEEYDGNNIYRLYADRSFGTVNKYDGTFTSMGKLSDVGGTPTALAWNWKNNTMYVMVLAANNSPHLYTLDLSTLQLTEVASNTCGAIIGMDFVNDSLIYAPSIDDDKLYKININTGTFTQVGNIGMDLNYGQDVAFDYDSLRLYTVTEGESENLGYYDITTGAFTSVTHVNSQYATLVSLTTPAPLYTVTFNVTDGTTPLANANILVANKVLHTNANGQVTINLMDNSYSAVTSLWGYANDTTNFEIRGSQMTVNITLSALSSYDLVFHVSDILGSDIENATVTVLYETDTLANGITDVNGNFDAGQQYATYRMHYVVSADGYVTYDADTALSTADIVVEVPLSEYKVTPYGLQIKQLNSDADIEFSWNNPKGFTEDFESGTLDDAWQIQQTCTDENEPTPSYWTVNDFSSSDFGPFGSYHAGLWWSRSHQDEWLITPEFAASNGMTFNFYSVCAHGSTHRDHYYVKVSTDRGNTWNVVWDASSLPFVDNNGDGEADIFYYDQVYTVDLSAYAGQNIKVAFQAVDGDGGGLWYIFFVDNISVDLGNGKYLTFDSDDLQHISYSAHEVNKTLGNTALAKSEKYNSNIRNAKVFQSFNVFLDGSRVATGVTDSSYVFEDLTPGQHSAGVCGVYTTENSDTAYIDFTVEDNTSLTTNNNQIIVYPNPVNDVVSIKTDGNYNLRIIDIDGRTVLATVLHDNTNKVNMAKLPEGIYFLQLHNNKANYNFRIFKK